MLQHHLIAAALGNATGGGGGAGGALASYTTGLWAAMSVAKLFSAATKSMVVYDTTATTTHNSQFAGSTTDSADLATFGGAHTLTVAELTNQHTSGVTRFDGASTPTKYPTVVNAGSYLGKLQFDGSSDVLASASASGGPSAYTVFLRGKLRSTSSATIIQTDTDYTSAKNAIAYYDSGNLVVAIHLSAGGADYAVSNFSGAAPNNNVHCYRWDRTQATGALQAVLFIDGVKQTRTSSGDLGTLTGQGNFAAKTWYLAAKPGASLFSDMDVHTCLIYESALSDADCTAISNIVAALP